MKRPLLLMLKVGLLAGLFVIAAGVGGLGYFHFGNPRNTCASCHEMTAVHSAWSSSAHAAVHCRNCHGGSLTLDVHALRAHVNRVVQHFSGNAGKPIRLGEKDILTLHDACQSCHARTFADWQASRHSATYARIFLDSAHNKAEQLAPDCLRCHGMFYGGNIEDLVGPLDVTGPWELKDDVTKTQAAIPCLACHQVHAPAAESVPAQLYVRREQAHFAVNLLPAAPIRQGNRDVRVSPDPRQRLCVQCHAPNAFRQLGTSDDRTPAGVHEGLSCFDCHQSHSLSARDSCTACHPGSSHCGIDVRKMDTTFNVRGSKHNVHTVACGDCHQGRRPPGATPQ
jgi:hypothetical protein